MHDPRVGLLAVAAVGATITTSAVVSAVVSIAGTPSFTAAIAIVIIASRRRSRRHGRGGLIGKGRGVIDQRMVG